jgi:hypothetical protein
MIEFPFDPQDNLIVVPVEVHGKSQLMTIPLIKAFGVDITNFKVVAHDLPPSLLVDGLLGMNFLKRAKLTIDFHKNVIKIPK